jgi:hypothetical protein
MNDDLRCQMIFAFPLIVFELHKIDSALRVLAMKRTLQKKNKPLPKEYPCWATTPAGSVFGNCYHQHSLVDSTCAELIFHPNFNFPNLNEAQFEVQWKQLRYLGPCK